MKKTFDCALSIKNCDLDGSFKGYASVFGVTDAQGEEVAVGAFKRSLKEWENKGKMPKLLWQHDYRKPIGFWQEIKEDAHGLFVKGQLLLDLTQGREAYSLLKNGIIDGLSIGFVTVRSKKSQQADQNTSVRILEEVNLHEISLVTFAANSQAKVNYIKMNNQELEGVLEKITFMTNLWKRGGKID